MAFAASDGDLSLSEVLELVRLFEAHRPRLLAMLRARIDPALEGRLGADAILQETFLVARRRWAGRPGADEMSPYAWLLWLARQCLFDAWRRERPGREIPWPGPSSSWGSLELLATGTTPSVAARRVEVQALVRRALEGLEKPADREIIELIDFEGLSAREAATILGIAENAANVRHFRALKRLRVLIPESLRQEVI
ncbi:MAG: sigma-70 family RNA polymerase sigma factor [Isosphaeraceae bacterium]|nr:sigma-70 family RNA polymerase sigma factor [Isosphaeraceae bacterium]